MRRELIAEFAKTFGLDHALVDVDGQFYAAFKHGADIVWDGWIVAEHPRPDRVLLTVHSDDHGEPDEDYTLNFEEFREVIRTGHDPFGRRIEDTIGSWSP